MMSVLMGFLPVVRRTPWSRTFRVYRGGENMPIADVACGLGKCRVALMPGHKLNLLERIVVSSFIRKQERCRSRGTVLRHLRSGGTVFSTAELATMTEAQKSRIRGRWTPPW